MLLCLQANNETCCETSIIFNVLIVINNNIKHNNLFFLSTISIFPCTVDCNFYFKLPFSRSFPQTGMLVLILILSLIYLYYIYDIFNSFNDSILQLFKSNSNSKKHCPRETGVLIFFSFNQLMSFKFNSKYIAREV